MSTILFVINPVSGSIQKSGLNDRILRNLKGSGFEAAFYETLGQHDLGRLKSRIDAVNPGIVVAAGGDGTANLAARAVLGTGIRLGFIPLGSANGIATELGISTNLREALEVIKAGHEIAMDILRINHTRYSVHLSDIGFNAHLIRRFEQQGRRGILTYARMFVGELFKMKTHHYIIHTGEGKVRIKAVMIVFANAGRYGTGVVINPMGRVDDGKFELIILKAFRFSHLVRLVIPFFTGRINRLEYVESFSGRSFMVENPELQDVHIDGEIIRPEKVIRAEILEKP